MSYHGRHSYTNKKALVNFFGLLLILFSVASLRDLSETKLFFFSYITCLWAKLIFYSMNKLRNAIIEEKYL